MLRKFQKRLNVNQPTLKPILVKLLKTKDKEKNLESSEEKLNFPYREKKMSNSGFITPNYRGHALRNDINIFSF